MCACILIHLFLISRCCICRSKAADQGAGSNRMTSTTKPSIGVDTKSSQFSTSGGWGTGSAFSAARPTTLGKTSTDTLGKSSVGKTVAAVSAKSSSGASVSGGSVNSTTTSSGVVKMSQSTLMSADKRLQNMKRKAKLAEKRPR